MRRAVKGRAAALLTAALLLAGCSGNSQTLAVRGSERLTLDVTLGEQPAR
jgi:uncharacterized lipoprotein YajG